MNDWLPFKVPFFLTCLLSVTNLTNGQYWSAADFPDPQTQPRECGQDKPSWICDPGKLIADPGTTAKLAAFLEEFQHINQCKCDCDSSSRPTYIKVAIGIVSGIEGSFADEGARKTAVQEFASDLAKRRWGSVAAGCGDHMVMVYSVREGAVGAAVGRIGAADGLTEDCVHTRWSENRDYFAEGDYGTGFIHMMEEFTEVAMGKASCSDIGGGNGGSFPAWAIGPIVAVGVVAAGGRIYCCYAKKRGCGCRRHSVEDGSGSKDSGGGRAGKDAYQKY